jgi:hypothetical protein
MAGAGPIPTRSRTDMQTISVRAAAVKLGKLRVAVNIVISFTAFMSGEM